MIEMEKWHGNESALPTLITAVGRWIFMPQEKLDFLFPGPPLLQMFVHHVLEGDRSL